MKKQKPKSYTPSPLFSAWWGPLADSVFHGAYKKHGASSRAKRAHKKDTHRTPRQKCPCEAFTLCDLAYQRMSAEDKKIWKDALKKPGMSAYELYMKECISSMIHTGTYPDCPTASGGFSCRLIKPGEDPAPDGWIGQMPTIEEKPLYPPGDACEYCSKETPSKVNCFIALLTGEGAKYNGKYVLPQITPCVWCLTIGMNEIGVGRWPDTRVLGWVYDDETMDYCE
ncbi:hypothetical protein ES705_32137 [subsurface metagenome]